MIPVAVVGGENSYPSKVADLGFQPIHLRTGLPPNGSDQRIISVQCDALDPNEVVERGSAAYSRRPFACALAVHEDGLLGAAHLNRALGLPGASVETVRLLVDKWAMRCALNDAGVSPVAARLATDETDLEQFGLDHGFPFIAKPVAASSSFGVLKIDTAQAIPSVAHELASAGRAAVLVEEFLVGDEISVETFSFNGEHVILTFTGKSVGDSFIEMGHLVPATLDESTTANVADTVRRFLDTVGLTDGPCHVEVKLTPNGPRVVEGHNRIGGDNINELVAEVYGIDVEALSLRWAAGQASAIDRSPTASGGAAIAFFAAEPGRLLAVEGLQGIEEADDVRLLNINFKVGDIVPPVRWGPDRPGFVITVGKTAEVAASRARQYAEAVTFVTDQSGEAPAVALTRQLELSIELDQGRFLGYDGKFTSHSMATTTS